jgi:hypothetical protein
MPLVEYSWAEYAVAARRIWANSMRKKGRHQEPSVELQSRVIQGCGSGRVARRGWDQVIRIRAGWCGRTSPRRR